MPSYVVESYTAGSGVEEQRERAQRAAEVSSEIRYVRTTFLPGDETVLHVFEAPSAEELDRAGRLAHLDFDRIVDAVERRTDPGREEP